MHYSTTVGCVKPQFPGVDKTSQENNGKSGVYKFTTFDEYISGN